MSGAASKEKKAGDGLGWALDHCSGHLRYAASGMGAEAVVRLRSLRASGDFEDYMAFHYRKDRQRNYPSAAQNDDLKLAP